MSETEFVNMTKQENICYSLLTQEIKRREEEIKELVDSQRAFINLLEIKYKAKYNPTTCKLEFIKE